MGPRGTFTEQALKANYQSLPSRPEPTVAEVFQAVAAGEAEAGLVPFENMLQGPVVETLDELLANKATVRITESVVLDITHSLGAPAGVSLDSVKHVYSHPQALRQCSRFLREKLSSVHTVSCDSTASAARAVSDAQKSAAAIAPRSALEAAALHVIAHDIGDHQVNKTRFVLIQRDGSVPISGAESGPWATTIAIEPGRDRRGLLYEILGIISQAHDLNLLSIHSRPDARGGFVFFVDLEGRAGEEKVDSCLKALDDYCATETGKVAGVSVFGSYVREPFYLRSIASIGIVGGLGRMGQWFTRFFNEIGIEVRVADRAGGEPLESVCAQCDAILLSVPMASMASVVSQIAPFVCPGQLIVENCSIKNSSIPHMLRVLPENCEILGIHTMFGPQTTELRSQNVVITKTERSGRKAQEFEDLFYKYGATMLYAGVDEHDKASAYIQSLYHLVLLGLAEVMRSEFASLDELERFSTPNARALLGPMKRVVNQSEELLGDLQTLNDQAPRTRALFLRAFRELVESLDSEDLTRLIASAKRSKEFLEK